MTSKRPVYLLGILLILLAGHITQSYWEARENLTPTPPAPLPGRNEISGVKVEQDDKGGWLVSFDYFYTGIPARSWLEAQTAQPGNSGSDPVLVGYPGYAGTIERGHHHAKIPLALPTAGGGITTRMVVVTMKTGNVATASQHVNYTIEWPDTIALAQTQRWAGKSSQDILKAAVEDIDRGYARDLGEAKMLLERILSKDPKFSPAYIELARIAMKNNWGPEGLHQAETLLSSAMQLDPGSINAKILLGYVYAHQKRYGPAKSLFEEVAPGNPPNLWLWTNWGELLAMQGQRTAAIEKLKVAIQHPPTNDTYDRARQDAYEQLLQLLSQPRDLDGMEALHKQRVSEYGARSCYAIDYGLFALQERGDLETSLRLARQALERQCEQSRSLLGMTYYAKWVDAQGPAEVDALNQARIFLPAGPNAIYQLAKSDRTLGAVRKLVKSGESIDQRDNRKLDALAYALQENDLGAVRRLLKLGASPLANVGTGDMPVALLPVLSGNLDAIRLMRQSGVDYKKIQYRGSTAIDHARQIGDKRLLEALAPASSA